MGLPRARPAAPSVNGRSRTVGRYWAGGVAVLLAMTVAVLMRLPALRLPLERDEGAYAYIANLWLHGGLPYRDVFDHKPPLLYLLYMPPVLAGVSLPLGLRLWAAFLFLIELPLI